MRLWHDCGLTRPWNDPDADLRRALAGPGSTVLAALDGDDLLGTAMVGHDGHRGWLYYLAVRADARGQGHGRVLVRACERWVLAQGIPKLQLMIRAGNTAVVGFYERLGYTDADCVVLGRRLEHAAGTLERVTTERGELVLRERDGALEVISNGVFLMDTRAGASERLLVSAALETLPAGGSVLIGGLGVGFSLAEAVASDRPGRIVVVEIEPDVVRWHRGPLAPFSAGALDDPRVEVVCVDLVERLVDDQERFDAICLDVDNGPDWTVFDGNRALYSPDGLRLLAGRLRPGGVLAVWSASEPAGFAERLAGIGPVDLRRVEVARGTADVVYLVRVPG